MSESIPRSQRTVKLEAELTIAHLMHIITAGSPTAHAQLFPVYFGPLEQDPLLDPDSMMRRLQSAGSGTHGELLSVGLAHAIVALRHCEDDPSLAWTHLMDASYILGRLTFTNDELLDATAIHSKIALDGRHKTDRENKDKVFAWADEHYDARKPEMSSYYKAADEAIKAGAGGTATRRAVRDYVSKWVDEHPHRKAASK